MKGKVLLSMFVLVLGLTSCQERGMQALVGEWLDAKNELQPLEVVQEDGEFTLVGHWGEYIVNMRDDRYPEVFFNGKSYPITHDAKTDQLKFNGISYLRKENSQKMQFVGKWSDEQRQIHFDIILQMVCLYGTSTVKTGKLFGITPSFYLGKALSLPGITKTSNLLSKETIWRIPMVTPTSESPSNTGPRLVQYLI